MPANVQTLKGALNAHEKDRKKDAASFWEELTPQQYRNSDYQRHQIDEDDITLVSKLVSLYAAASDKDTKTPNGLMMPLPGDTPQDFADRKEAIKNGIHRFFEVGKGLVSDEREKLREEQNGIGSALVKDDFSAAKEKSAYSAIQVLGTTLRNNRFLEHVAPQATARIGLDSVMAHSAIRPSSFLGQYYAGPELGAQEQTTRIKEIIADNGEKMSVTVTEPANKKSLDDTEFYGRDVDNASCYDLLVGATKAIEQYSAKDLKKALYADGEKGAAARLLFQKAAGKEFDDAADSIRKGPKSYAPDINPF